MTSYTKWKSWDASQFGLTSKENALYYKKLFSRYLLEAKNVLEIGCGCGRNAQFFGKEKHNTKHIKYFGFDVSKEALNLFYSNKYWENSKESHYTSQEIDDEILKNKYDLIFSSYVFQHIGIGSPDGIHDSLSITSTLFPKLNKNGYIVLFEQMTGQNNWDLKSYLSFIKENENLLEVELVFPKQIDYPFLQQSLETLEGTDLCPLNLVVLKKK
jgi:SAM-dependent methyltransferase